MLGLVKEINGEKTIIPLTTDAGAGAPVGSLLQQYKKKPMSGYLYCDGSTFDQNAYPALYMYLGSNVLPDYRECVMVGAEQNTTDTIATHDIYGEGEFKDDQFQEHKHAIGTQTTGTYTGGYSIRGHTDGLGEDTINKDTTSPINVRTGETTHGKQKAVYVYIKATSGLAENQQDNVLNDVKDYVNNSNSYSTNEIKTGGTWIDGKPIYRKVLNINGYPETIQTGLTSANEVVGMVCKNTVGVSDNNFTFGGILTDNNTYYPWAYQLSSDNTTLTRITTTYSGTVKFIILEYTKTTD